MWLAKAGEAGFEEVTILSRLPMDEDRVTRYPIYQEGGLDELFDLVAPDERWRLVESATIRAVKRQGSGPPRGTAPSVCRIRPSPLKDPVSG